MWSPQKVDSSLENTTGEDSLKLKEVLIEQNCCQMRRSSFHKCAKGFGRPGDWKQDLKGWHGLWPQAKDINKAERVELVRGVRSKSVRRG